MGWFSRLRGRFTFHRWASRNLEALKLLVRLRETAYRPEALQRFHALLAEAPPVHEVANFWQAIARWCQDAGAYREAEQALGRAKTIYEQTVGLQHPDAWHVLDQLSLALFSLGRFDEAQAAAEGSLAMKTELWGRSSPKQESWQDPALDLACFGVCSTPAPWLGADVQSFHATVSDLVARTGGGLVDVERFLVAGRAAARVITKHPRQPHGMTYLGVLLIQDAAQVFAIRIGCTEQGATGYRDAVILHEQLAGIAAEQEAELALRRLSLYGQDHPMSVHSEQEGVRAVRNRSEDEEYDARFPAHPLSRARRMMRLFSQRIASLGS